MAGRALPPAAHHRAVVRLVLRGAGGHGPLRPGHSLRVRHPPPRTGGALRERLLSRGEDKRYANSGES